jgi:hypothetical protein
MSLKKGIFNTKWTDDELRVVKEKYPELGGSILNLLPGRTINQVRNVAKNLGIKLSKESRRSISQKSSIKSEDKYKVNSLLFTDTGLMSPRESYILGLIWSDGYICRPNKDGRYRKCIRLSTTSPDFYHYNNIMNNGTDVWECVYTKSCLSHDNWKQNIFIITHNPYIHSKLLELGYDHKIDSGKVLNFLPDDQKLPWLLGVIDGDGCWSTSKNGKTMNFKITGQYDVNWTPLQDYLSSLRIVSKVERRENKLGNRCSDLTVRRLNDCFELGSKVYQYKELALPRKYEKWKSWATYREFL